MTSTHPSVSETGTWRRYYQITSHRSPSKMATRAVPYASPMFVASLSECHALDLGAGAHIDAEYLLQCGFKTVTTVDASPDARPYAELLGAKFGERFQFHQELFSDFNLEQGKYRFILSNYALPMYGEDGFDDFVSRVLSALDPHGVFSAVFFGPTDEWRDQKQYAFRTSEWVQKTLSPFGELFVHETNGRDRLTDDSEKLWHRIEVILRKRP